MLNSALTVSVSCFLDADFDLMFPSLGEAALLASVLSKSGASTSGLSARKDSCQSAGTLIHKQGWQVDTAITLLHAGSTLVRATYLIPWSLLHNTARQVQ